MFFFSQNHEHEEKLHRRHLERDVNDSDLDAVDSDEDSCTDNYYGQSDKHIASFKDRKIREAFDSDSQDSKDETDDGKCKKI